MAGGILLLLIGHVAQAQGELSPFFLSRAHQTTLLNPAATDGAHVSIGLPSVSVMGSHTGFSFGDLIQQAPGMDSTFVAFTSLPDQLRDRNRLQADLRVDWLSVAIGIKKFRLLAGLSSRGRMDLSYPKDLIRLATNGNAAYLDQAMQLGPGFHGIAWQELYAGGQVGIGNKLRIGGRLKYLSGTGYVGSNRHNLTWTTRADSYVWDVNVDYQLQTAGLDLGELNGSPSSQTSFQPEFSPAIFRQHQGMAMDLGAIFQPIEKLTLGVSALDLGGIFWKDNARSFDVAGQFSFEGVDLSPLLRGDSIQTQGLADSMLAGIDWTAQNQNFYTALPARYLISVSYEPLKWLRTSAVIQAERYLGSWNPALAVGAQLRVKQWLDFGLSWSARQGQWDILGLQTSIKTGPIVTYFMSDHVLAPLRPRHAQTAHFRVGMNVQIGKK